MATLIYCGDGQLREEMLSYETLVAEHESAAVLAAVAEHRVTDVLLVPTMVQALVDHPQVADYGLSSMHWLLYGGSTPSEVETALSKHPAVAASAVIGLPAGTYGERVHACIVLAPEQRVTAEDLRAFCREHIAGYKTPRSVEFRDELPVSGAGKILKRELRESYDRKLG